MANKDLTYNFKNKNVLVLGGSGLVGKSVISNLIKANANIVNIDLKNITTKYKKYFFYKFDFQEKKNIKNILMKNINFSHIDILINTLYPKNNNWSNSNFNNISYNDLEQNSNINLYSILWSSKVVADLMKKNLKGSIILMNSIYGIRGQDLSIYKNTKIKENFSYSVMKGAITNGVRQMASFYGKYNIRINSVCAGGLIGENSMTNKKLSKNFIKNYSSRCPLNRLGTADEISDVILFLASDHSSYITGTNLVVDGGWTSV